MDNRPTVIKSANRSFPAYGVDLHDSNALSRTRRICVHRPAGNDPERPENLVDAEMTVSNQSRSANFRRYANQRGAAALRRRTELDLRGTR